MSDSTFFVSKAALRNLKHSAQHRVSGVSSSHLSEALASALGFKTHAALRVALDGRVTVEVPKPNNARMVRRLQELATTPRRICAWSQSSNTRTRPSATSR